MANLFDPDNSLLQEPETIVVGDFVQWRRQDIYNDYPPSVYNMGYVARVNINGTAEFSVSGSSYDSQYWLFSVSSSDSAEFIAGLYHWQLEATRISDGERIVLERGTFTLVNDLDINGIDPRSHAEIMVAKIESVLENRADSDVQDYSIAGRSLTKIKVEELIKWRDYYRAEVAKERRKSLISRGKSSNSTVKVFF